MLILPQTTAAAGKPDKIHVAAIGDFSGPYAPVVGSHKPGAEDAWKYFNEDMGGIMGVKVVPLMRDTGGKVALGLTMYNELINMKPRPIFVDTSLTPLGEALRPRLVEDGIVGIHAGALVSVYPLGNSYAYYPMYDEWMGTALDWIKKSWTGKGNPRVGILTWDTGYGRAVLTEKGLGYFKKAGVDMAGKPLVYGIRDVEVTTQLMALRAQKADYIYSNTTAGGVLAVAKGCREMGWKVPILASGLDFGTVKLAPQVLEGHYQPRPFVGWQDNDNPGLQFIMKQFNKNNRTEKDKSAFYFIGWVNAAIQHRVMNEVVHKHGWDGLNAENLKAAMNNIKDFEVLEGVTTITYSAKRPVPKHIRMYQVRNGTHVPVSDWQEAPDMMPDN
jgi:ABC-type branched-subunit amino acid transport system substrate-binding protein